MALDRKSTLTVVGEQEPTLDDALRQMLTSLIHDVLEREFTQHRGPRRSNGPPSGGRDDAWRCVAMTQLLV